MKCFFFNALQKLSQLGSIDEQPKFIHLYIYLQNDHAFNSVQNDKYESCIVSKPAVKVSMRFDIIPMYSGAWALKDSRYSQETPLKQGHKLLQVESIDLI